MGNSLEQFRATIGCFAPVICRILGRLCERAIASRVLVKHGLTSMATLITVINLIMMLLFRGGVELNPGPRDKPGDGQRIAEGNGASLSLQLDARQDKPDHLTDEQLTEHQKLQVSFSHDTEVCPMSKTNPDDESSKSDDDGEPPLEVSKQELTRSEDDPRGPEASAESPGVSQFVNFGINDSRNASSSMEEENTSAAAVIQTAGVLERCILPKEDSSNEVRVLGGNTRLTQQKESRGYITVETGSDHSTDRSQVQVHGSADQTLARLQDICPNLSQVIVYLNQEVTNTAFVENPSAVVVGNNTVVNQGVEQERESDEDKPPSKVQILRNATLKTIHEWTEGMVHTRAVTTLVDKLSAAPPVFVVKGQPGEGKTTVAMMALKRLYDMGRNVFIIKTSEEYMTVKSMKDSVILVNDVFGSSDFHISNLSLWDKVFDDQLALMEHTGQQKTSKSTILLVSRSSVLDSASEHFGRFRSLILREGGVMDLTEDMTYTTEEKRQIWSYHAKHENVEVDEAKVYRVCKLHLIHGFPHCCRLCAEMYSKNPNLDIEFFFTSPIEFLKQKIKSMFADDVAGPLLRDMLQNDGVYSGDVCNTREKSYQIKKVISEGEGIYFRQKENQVTFHHPSIYDAVAFIACEKDPSFVIDCCSMQFLNDRVRLEELFEFHKEEQATVSIHSRFRINIMRRMETEMAAGNISDVLSHHSFYDWHFVKQFMEELLSGKSDSESVRRLIQQEDKLTNESFLVISTKSKSSNILRYICERVTFSPEEQKDILFSICKNRSPDSMHYFLKRCPQCDLSVKGGNGESLLTAAAQSRCGDILILLMTKGVNVQDKDQDGCTSLYYVCTNGVDKAAAVVHMMLKNGANVNDMCSFDTTPLVLACYYGHTSLVEALLNGNNEKITQLLDKRGEISTHMTAVTPLCAAVLRGFEKIVEILLNKGAEINKCDESNKEPLGWAYCVNFDIKEMRLSIEAEMNTCDQSSITGRSETTIEMLLRKGAEISTCSEGGRTPLHDACERGYDAIVQMLLNKEAEMNTRDKRGRTPLLEANERGTDTVVQMLLNKGAEINIGDKIGRTPLQVACERGSDTRVQIILNKGAEVNTRDKRGRTPLHEACMWRSDNVEVNTCDWIGLTPLHGACLRRSDSIVEMLLSKGAEVNTRDENDRTPLHDTCKRGFDTIVKMLLSEGAETNKCDKSGRTPLHDACIRGSDMIVEMLLSKGAEVNTRDENDRTPLHDACKRGFDTIVKMLLSEGAETNTCDKSGRTPLHDACIRGSDMIVQMLLSEGAEIKTCDEKDSTPLHEACNKGSDTIVQMLLNKGAEMNTLDKRGRTPLHDACMWISDNVMEMLLSKASEINTCDMFGSTPLHIACKIGSNTKVDMLLSKGAEVNTCDDCGNTPLHDACGRGSDTSVKMLLSKGAEINACDDSGRTPLHIACISGSETIVKMLLSKGVDMHKCDKSGRTPLHDACIGGSYSIVNTLLSKGAKVNTSDGSGSTPLHAACGTGSSTLVEILLSNGAKINTSAERGGTPLHIACERGSVTVVQKLLCEGAEIYTIDKDGRTPLHDACLRNHDTIVEMLLSKGAEINTCDVFGITPLHVASVRGSDSVLNTLLSKGAEIDTCDESGRTPVQYACLEGFYTIVEMLLSKGVDINTHDVHGRTPLHNACQSRSDTIVEMLLGKGAEINTCDKSGSTPLHYACGIGSDAIVQRLLSKGAEINACDHLSRTPLDVARWYQLKSIVTTLVKRGAKSGRVTAL